MARKLVKRVVSVEEHDFKGEQYVGITVLSTYDDGAAYPKVKNFPKAILPDLLKQLNALMAGA